MFDQQVIRKIFSATTAPLITKEFDPRTETLSQAQIRKYEKLNTLKSHYFSSTSASNNPTVDNTSFADTFEKKFNEYHHNIFNNIELPVHFFCVMGVNYFVISSFVTPFSILATVDFFSFYVLKTDFKQLGSVQITAAIDKVTEYISVPTTLILSSALSASFAFMDAVTQQYSLVLAANSPTP